MLRQQLPKLKAIGIDGINISLDSCDAKTYTEITGSDCLEEVLVAIEEAYTLGLPVKINCVPLSNMQEADLLAMLELVKERNIPLRFIELMPLSCNSELQGISGEAIRSKLAEAGIQLSKIESTIGNGPAVYYQAEGYAGAIGFIEPLHNKFCDSCNRIRLTATGLLKPCLYAKETFDLQALLRNGANDEEILEALRQAIYAKPQGHAFEICPANFPMNAIGG
jgi:cyclic pyranopterin phosphate synthase